MRNPAFYVGGDGNRVCHFAYFGLERWAYDDPSPLFGFPGWHITAVPHLDRVVGAAVVVPWASDSGLPVLSFAGQDRRSLYVRREDSDDPLAWRWLSPNDDLPTPIRGYGTVPGKGVEWFMSATEVASHGLAPQEQRHDLRELVGNAAARGTWLAVGETDVWVGTAAHGVVQIDPETQTVTQHTTAHGLPADEIRDVQYWVDGHVWVATQGGAAHWDGARWTAYTVQDGLPDDDVRGISPDYAGDAWAATAAGAAHFDHRLGRWRVLPNLPAGIDLTGVARNTFSTRGQGLVRFVEGGEWRGTRTRFTAADGLPSDAVTALATTAAGVLVGTPAGVGEWTGAQWQPVLANPANDLSADAIGTDAGLWVRQAAGWTQVTTAPVSHVAGGGWYVGDDRICRWSEATVDCGAPPQEDAPADVQALYADADGRRAVAVAAQALWFLEQTADGVRVVTSARLDDLNYATAQPPRDLTRHHDRWLLASREGIYVIRTTDDGALDAFAVADFGLARGWPVAVRRTRAQPTTAQAWIAMPQDAFVRGTEGGWRYVVGLPSRDVTAIAPAPDGSVWVGTARSGLFHLAPETP